MRLYTINFFWGVYGFNEKKFGDSVHNRENKFGDFIHFSRKKIRG